MVNGEHTFSVNFADSVAVYDGEKFEFVQLIVKRRKSTAYSLYEYCCIDDDLKMVVFHLYHYKGKGYRLVMRRYGN